MHTPVALAILLLAAPAAQPLDEQIDHQAVLEGLVELQADDLAHHYLRAIAADDPALPALLEIATARRAVLKAADARAFDEAVETLCARHESLLSTHRLDARAPLWQGDYAFSILFVLSTARADLAQAELGFMEPQRFQTFLTRTRQAADLAEEALAGVADAILDLEDSPDFVSNAELRQRRRRLITQEQSSRLPFLFDTARCRLAAIDPEFDRASALESAAALAELAPALPEPWRTHALLRSARTAALHGDAASARRSLQAIPADTLEDPLDRFAAALTALRLTADHAAYEQAVVELADEPFVQDDAFLSLLAADQLCRARLHGIGVVGYPWNAQRADGSRLTGAQAAEAVAAYDAFLADASPQDRPLRESLVSLRLAALVPPDAPVDSLPDDVLLALARRLTTQDDQSHNAVVMLRSLLARESLNEQIAAPAHALLVTALADADRPVSALEAALTMAQRFPDHPQTDPTVEFAAALAARLSVEGAVTPRDRPLFRDILTLALDRFGNTPDADAWRYRLGRFEADTGDLDAAQSAFESIGISSALRTDAQFQLALLALRRAETHRTPEAWAAALETVQTVTEELESCRMLSSSTPQIEQLTDDLAALALLQARIALETDDPETALRRLDAADPEALQRREALRSEALSIRIGALLTLNRTDEARAALDALAQGDPSGSGPLVLRLFDQVRDDLLRTFPADPTADQRADAADRLLPLAELGWSIAQTTDPQSALRRLARLRLAEARLHAGRFDEALEIYEYLERTAPDSPEVILGLAECRYRRGVYEEALRGYRALLTALRPQDGRDYWLCELRSLQILKATGRQTQQIAPRLSRLRLLDAELGGEPFAQSWEEVGG